MLNENIRIKKNELICLKYRIQSIIKLKNNPFNQFITMIIIIMTVLISNSHQIHIG